MASKAKTGATDGISSGKSKALETTLATLSKKFGDGVVMKLGDASKLTVESIPTGSFEPGYCIGHWGCPQGPCARNLRSRKFG